MMPGLPHGYGWPLAADATEPAVRVPPTVEYDAPCDVCGQPALWRTILIHANNVQETSCGCSCLDEVAAA